MQRANSIHPEIKGPAEVMKPAVSAQQSVAGRLRGWLGIRPMSLTSFRTNNLSSFGLDVSQAASFIRMVPVPICIISGNGAIHSFNASFGSLTSVDLGRSSILDLFSPTDADRFAALMQTSSKMFEASGEFVTLTSDRRERLFSWNVCRAVDSSYFVVTGQPVHHEVPSDEVSQYLRASDRACASASQSMAPPKAYRKNSAFVELQDAQQKFTAMNHCLETKRTFVRHVSHEIRTPLNVVMSGLDLLHAQSTTSSEDAAEIVADMRSACMVAINILNDLLTYEKLDSNLLALEKSHCDCIELMRRVYKMFQIPARHASIDLRFDKEVPSETVVVEADAMKLSQVFRNLVSNAIKFTPKDGTVTIKAYLLTDSSRVRFEVQDTGAGISKEDRKKLFQEVVQFNAAALQNGQGSGLGLYLSRHIIDMHGGSIGVDLAWEGKGSVFYVELPTSNHQESNKIARKLSFIYHSDHADHPGLLHEVRRRRLLIVDDATLCRKFHRRMLGVFNAECFEASDGKEAVDMVRESLSKNAPFDAILMDSNMPFMSGYEAMELIRKLGFTGKVFGVTGNAFQSDIDQFIAYGADEVVVKPVSIDKYAYMVQTS